MTSTTRDEPVRHRTAAALAQPATDGVAFVGVCALLFAASAAGTAMLHDAMSSMAAMPMPGGWTMSTVWMPMCGQTWAGAALAFVGMWGLMMAAMMLPSLAPSLWRYRLTVGLASHAWRLTAWVATGYVFVWTLLGLALFGVGACVAALALQWPALARAMPVLAGAIVLMAGAWQFTAWKAHLLACCMTCPVATAAPVMPLAWRHGLRLGMVCIGRCAGAIACMVAGGIMDPAVMAIATIAITAERLAPAKWRVVGWIGAAGMIAGASMVAHHIGNAADVALYIPIVHSSFQEDAFPCGSYDAHPYELAGWQHGDGIQQPQANA